MSIQNLILGSLVSRGADKLLNPNRKNITGIDKFISGGGIGQESEEKDKGPTTFGGIAKQGIMSLIAQAILGPVFGPLALTLGQNIAAKKGQGIMPYGGPFNFGRPDAPTVEETAGKYGITNIENIKDVALPESGPAGDSSLTYDYGITQGIDSSDSQAVADAIDSSTPDDFGQSEGMVDGWED